ncbi:putative B3 domain-containing protein Os03g0621600 [Trifolium pratense]|uniref:putative B3 domain-containing protein Os03g0621600 n=1 Tax=Trifolium pratense TaxID=57577 RepID=UPI001E690462|nr:putative B3 domain-containing protein Os03g0621600 [Trifolium pratense]XP_045820358.1 putative B3 domain-containing protein Os03g0621600 [Trifolium pratense]
MSLYNTPKFFKIIQNHELQNGEIRIPKKFVEKYWKGVPNPIVIILPNGAQQEIFWAKRDGDIWFKKNWDKISKFLKFGYLVIFKYIGGASFKLKIFGINCLEIDCPIDEEVVSDESVEAEFGTSSDEFVDQTDIAGTSHRRICGRNRGSMKKRVKNCSTRKTTNGIGTSRGVANPSFEHTLTTTSAHGYILRIPCEFSRRFMEAYEGIAWIRRLGEDRTWEVDVKYDPEGDYSILNRGWKQFSDQYNLQIGDTCEFQMTRSKPPSFTVAIIRA